MKPRIGPPTGLLVLPGWFPFLVLGIELVAVRAMHVFHWLAGLR